MHRLCYSLRVQRDQGGQSVRVPGDQAKGLFAAVDPVGAANDEHIRQTVRAAGNIACAWGPNASKTRRPRPVVAMLVQMGAGLKCLHVTQDGTPGHSLMLSYDPPLLAFNASEVVSNLIGGSK